MSDESVFGVSHELFERGCVCTYGRSVDKVGAGVLKFRYWYYPARWGTY